MVVRMLMRRVLAVMWFGMLALPAQVVNRLDEVHRVYLAFPPGKPSLAKVKSDLERSLEQSGVQVVPSSADADAVLSASGDVYVKGYVSLNPRSGTGPHRGEPVMGGYLSVELKGKGNETLWSYLATPRFGSTQIERALSKQVTKELIIAMRTKGSGQP
jgi:hypothetical protein